MNARTIMIMAGGTGGHIFPGLAVARLLISQGVSVSWLGTPHGMENRVVAAEGIELEQIEISGLRGRGLLGWLAAPWRVFRAMLQARKVFQQRKPHCVLSMGGYVAGPGGLMARLMGIPLVIHEQNAIAGMTNRWLRPLAARIMTGFPDVLKNGRHCGNPVRADISGLADPEQRYGQRQGPLGLLVIGGSLGAAAFSDTIPAALALLPEEQRPRVLHQAGRQFEATREAYVRHGVEGEVVEFIDDMATAWGQADLAICRAGALTVSELAAAGVAALLVPFPHAVDDHQTANARYLTTAHAAWLVSERVFNPDMLAERLAGLSREQLTAMAGRARGLARMKAAEQVAEACLEVAA
jgi:UDP-N-acetylglucosamine--N-acetylmuramyl-(pentapeptide) pyrophosphoryl-undecaprenol N-acetylglucosamine transferase